MLILLTFLKVMKLSAWNGPIVGLFEFCKKIIMLMTSIWPSFGKRYHLKSWTAVKSRFVCMLSTESKIYYAMRIIPVDKIETNVPYQWPFVQYNKVLPFEYKKLLLIHIQLDNLTSKNAKFLLIYRCEEFEDVFEFYLPHAVNKWRLLWRMWKLVVQEIAANIPVFWNFEGNWKRLFNSCTIQRKY